jgi:hypothetical protein
MWEESFVITLKVLSHTSLGGTPMMLLEAFRRAGLRFKIQTRNLLNSDKEI